VDGIEPDGAQALRQLVRLAEAGFAEWWVGTADETPAVVGQHRLGVPD